ncbi:MAG: capsular polysaccharide biosynthesis protein CapF [Eubacteriaceae bacterium]|nr:capsular polysaccharide biosynthesis protein CapF [Eubacteriaceae bacterium]
MKILVTGAHGFVGKNLIEELKKNGEHTIYSFDRENSQEDLELYAKECEFVFHLAGVNRPVEEKEFMEGNFGFTSDLLKALKRHNSQASVLITSSIQAELDNPYGKSKKAGEDLIFEYSEETGARVFVYRLPNLFGKWSRPNYNTVVATFCYNLARDMEIKINDPDAEMKLVYIDDLIEDFIRKLQSEIDSGGRQILSIDTVYTVKLGKIAELIYSFKSSRENKYIPDMSDGFTKKLYSTYLSFIPENNFSYNLKMNVDERGSFTEFIKTSDRGQVSVNISKPGITKGNHWHHTKNEKFLVVSGEGIIRFRKVGAQEIIQYKVSGEKLQVVDIPVGYTHNISNTGTNDMVTIMWVNECFDPGKPDTYFLEV